MLDMATGLIIIEDTILAACEIWLGTAVNKTRVMKMLSESFKHAEARGALEKLHADSYTLKILLKLQQS